VRIVFLAPSYSPKLGGVEIHAQNVAELLVQRGHVVSVLTLAHGSQLPENEKINGVAVRRSHSGGKLAMWKFIGRNFSLLWQADIIHVHDVMWWLAPWLPLLFWKRIHLTHHGWEGTYPIPLKNRLQRWVWAHCARTLTHVGAWIKEYYWETPDFVTYGAVEGPALQKKTDGAVQKNEAVHIVFLGRLEPENDIEKYVALAKLLKQQSPELKITWVGDGVLRSECAKVGKVTGWVSDTTSYLESATLVWASSYLSILQAQAMGKVVCAAYTPGLKRRYLETFPGFQWMIAGFEDESLSKQILDLLEHPRQRQTRAEPAQAWAQKQTWGKLVDQYLILWK
jgi:glycosyltransferase involved in cell wall biosynthesis